MSKLAFLFTQMPHGSSAGREGLDAILASSTLSEDIALFFIGDGIFQLNAYQKPEIILARNYINTFKILSLYEFDQCFICQESLLSRGQNLKIDRVLNVRILNSNMFRKKLSKYKCIICF